MTPEEQQLQNDLDLTVIQHEAKGFGIFNNGATSITIGFDPEANMLLNMASHAMGKGLSMMVLKMGVPEPFIQLEFARLSSQVAQEALQIAHDILRRKNDPIPPL